MREEAERKREEDKESYILPELKIFLNFSITELMFLHYATFTIHIKSCLYIYNIIDTYPFNNKIKLTREIYM